MSDTPANGEPAPGGEPSAGHSGRGRPRKPFVLDGEMAFRLRAMMQENPEAGARVRQMKGLLLLAEGHGPSVVSRRLRVAASTVVGWRKEFERQGLESIRSVPVSGGKRQPPRRLREFL